MWARIIFFNFLFFLQIQLSKLAKTTCRNFNIDEMETLHYQSPKWGQMRVQIANGSFNEGSSGQIFVGYVDKFLPSSFNENRTIKDKCVAIKIYDDENERDYENGVTILTKLIEHDVERKHIVNMMDHGTIAPDQMVEGFVCIMELGDMSFDQELQRGKSNRSNKELKTLIKEVMQILAILHNVAIHLDFKAQNLLLFANKSFMHDLFMFDAGFTLKLADFDGSALLNGDDQNVEVHHPILTPLYSAPELLQQRDFKDPTKKTGILTSAGKMIKGMVVQQKKKPRAIHVTTKMDIWSAGITVYEIVLSNFLSAEQAHSRTINQGDFKKILEDRIGLIGELYRFAKLYEQPDADLFEMIVKQELESARFDPGSPAWWQRYSGVVGNILDMWRDKYAMLDIAYLLVNMLDVDPKKRMSAKGIIDYLEGKCRPAQINAVLFSNVSAEKLRYWLVDNEISRVNMITAVNREDRYYKWLKRLEKKLAKAEACQQDFLKQLANRTTHCDNGFS